MAPSVHLKESPIYHCIDTTEILGGTETYVANLIQNRPHGVSEQTLPSLRNIDQSKFKLLHIHKREALLDYRGECPAVYTLHNHSAYCSSGTKYLSNQRKCCNRQLSSFGCAWGHFIDGCGSLRPQKFIRKFRETSDCFKHIKALKIPVIANSNYVRKQLIFNGLPTHQVSTLHCTIQPPSSPPVSLRKEEHQNHRFLFVGRLVPMKGVEWLLRALATLEEPIHLDIAGEGWYRSDLEKLSDDLKITHRVTWHGWCNQEQLTQLYQSSTALIVPSIWPEPAGLVTLEAYAHARSVIASDVGGIPEYIRENKTGLLVQPNNIQALATAILQLYRNYPSARNMGDQGYILLKTHFSFSAHIQELQRIYEKAIDAFRSSVR